MLYPAKLSPALIPLFGQIQSDCHNLRRCFPIIRHWAAPDEQLSGARLFPPRTPASRLRRRSGRGICLGQSRAPPLAAHRPRPRAGQPPGGRHERVRPGVRTMNQTPLKRWPSDRRVSPHTTFIAAVRTVSTVNKTDPMSDMTSSSAALRWAAPVHPKPAGRSHQRLGARPLVRRPHLQ